MKELLEALVKAQKEIKAPKKDGENKHLKNRYATLDNIYEACRQCLHNHGIIITHDVENKEGRDWLVTSLIHTSGEKLTNRMPVFSMQSNNQSQGFAAGLTYSRRYAICCLLSLPSDEDDDGESITPREPEKKEAPPTSHDSGPKMDAQTRRDFIERIEEQLKNKLNMRSDMFKYYKAKSWDDIPSSRLPTILKEVTPVQ